MIKFGKTPSVLILGVDSALMWYKGLFPSSVMVLLPCMQPDCKLLTCGKCE